MSPAAAQQPDAVPVVVDTDLAPDDLAALALLLRHPRVRVVAVTVPQTGELDYRGTGLLGDFFHALGTAPPPVACGSTPRGEDGVMFPPEWGAGALMNSGLPRDGGGELAPVRTPAAELIARLARRHAGLQVVAPGAPDRGGRRPARAPGGVRPAGRRHHDGRHGRRRRRRAEGVGEWNIGADPVPFAEVLAGPVPVTVLPGRPGAAWRPGRAGRSVDWWGGSASSPGSSRRSTGTSRPPARSWTARSRPPSRAPGPSTRARTGDGSGVRATDRCAS